MNALAITQAFLDKVFTGDLDAAMGLVADNAKFIPTQPAKIAGLALTGTYVGPDGARQLFAQFAALLEPGDFNVEASISEGTYATMYGKLRHKSRHTGRDFISDWALITRVDGGKLTLYHFYEDTLSLFRAVQPTP